MRIIVKAKPRSKEEKVERLTQPSFGFDELKAEFTEYRVSIKESPVDGKANEAIIRALAKYFDVAPSLVRMISGKTSKHKVFEIPDEVR